MKKFVRKFSIEEGDASCTYRQSKMCRYLFGWYAPVALTKAEASALIERGLAAQKDNSFKIALSTEEKERLGGMGSVYIKVWLERSCNVRGKRLKTKAKKANLCE